MDGTHRISLEAVVGNIGDYTDDAILITEAEPVELPGPRILWANKAFCRMTGYTLDEIYRKTPRILQGSDTDPAALAKIRTALKQWKPVRVELKNYRKDGTPFWVDLGIQPVTDETGWHHYWVAIQRETTERHEREDLLERTTKIIESAPIAFGLLKSDSRLTFANDYFKNLMFGDRMTPALPLPYDSWLRRALHDSADLQILNSAEWLKRHMGGLFSTPARIEQRLRGSWFEFRRITTFAGDQLIIGENIEDRIKLRDQLRHITKLDAMGQLTSGVAHDFNNILAVILGNIELLQIDGEKAEDRDVFITEAINAVLKGRSLTQSLLTFARKSHMDPKNVDLAALVAETVNMFTRTSARGIEVKTDCNPKLPPVYLDPNLFQNALLNLLINSRDALPVGGEIMVSARGRASEDHGTLAGRLVEVNVVDNGTGMEEHVLHQAIEPFFTTKDVGSGSGLGLSMVHGFVEQSGGILSIRSAVNKGTTVTMVFPVDEENFTESQELLAHDSVLPSLKILVVEDEASIRLLLVRFLEKAGAVVHAVETGDAAAAIRESWGTYDLLITDIVMPGLLQGDILAGQFSDRCPETPIMLMSGNPEIMNSVRPRGSARTAILGKPVRQAELFRAIADLVR